MQTKTWNKVVMVDENGNERSSYTMNRTAEYSLKIGYKLAFESGNKFRVYIDVDRKRNKRRQLSNSPSHMENNVNTTVFDIDPATFARKPITDLNDDLANM